MHQIRLAVQYLERDRFATVFNFVGLSCSFAACCIILLYVWNEYRYDRYNKHFDDIYRVEVKFPSYDKNMIFLSGPTSQTLIDEFPEVELATTFMPMGKWSEAAFSWNNSLGSVKQFEDYAYSDENLTEIFTFNIVQGKKEKPLNSPNVAIVSESFAGKAWGSDDPIGKTLECFNSSYTVSAVYRDLPENSVIRCPIILAMPKTGWIGEGFKQWDIIHYPQFIRVRPGTKQTLLEEKINNESALVSKYQNFVGQGASPRIHIRPLRELRFTDEVLENPLFTTNNKLFVDTLFWVGILVLLVAFINYINFTTASIPKQIRSISITRLLGGKRADVVQVFLIKALMLFTVSYVAAVLLAYMINHYFSASILGYELSFQRGSGLLVLCGVCCMGMGGLLSVFPAMYSISWDAIRSINRFKNKSKVNYRGILTIAQFVATIALIVASVTVIKQVQYMNTADLGFHAENKLVLYMNDELKKNKKAFNERLEQSPLIQQFAYSLAVPGASREIHVFTVDGKNCNVWYWATDDKYIEMMGFTLLEGRQFLKNTPGENGNMICNEAAMKRYGWKLGQKIGEGTIVGVIKDFNYISLREAIEPFAFWYSATDEPLQSITIKLSTNRIAESIDYIRKAYNDMSPSVPFRFFFQGDKMKTLYTKENQQVRLIVAFSILSVLITILGILGMSIFICQTRIKEIGIRKVNGAHVNEILRMLSVDFIKWVILAYLIAAPLGYYFMTKWLDHFTYRTILSGWIFVMAGGLALFIALLTVSVQSWKAASKNPVEALRYE